MFTATPYASLPTRTWSYAPTGRALAMSWVWFGAAGTLPETRPTVTQDPSVWRSMSVDAGKAVSERPAATTTSVPVAGCRRGATHRTPTAMTATRAATIHKTRARVR